MTRCDVCNKKGKGVQELYKVYISEEIIDVCGGCYPECRNICNRLFDIKLKKQEELLLNYEKDLKNEMKKLKEKRWKE